MALRMQPPRGLAWLFTRLYGKTILMVGPIHSGKSAFLSYLTSGTLAENQTTPHTLKVEQLDDVVIVSDEKNGRDQFRIHRPLDVPGEHPASQVEYIARYKPDALVIVLDVSQTQSSEVERNSKLWLAGFIQAFERLIDRNEGIGRKLRLVLILMNKWDLVETGPSGQEFEQYVENSLSGFKIRTEGKSDLYKRIKHKRCTSVRTRLGSLFIDEAISYIAHSF